MIVIGCQRTDLPCARTSSAHTDGVPGQSPDDPESPEQLLLHLTVRGRGTLLAYSSHKPQVGASAAARCIC